MTWSWRQEETSGKEDALLNGHFKHYDLQLEDKSQQYVRLGATAADKREQLVASRKWLSTDARWNPHAVLLKGQATITAHDKPHSGKKSLRSHTTHILTSGEGEVNQSKPNPRADVSLWVSIIRMN